ncbi:RNase adapter RapZ [Gynuella sp.]|uniref:RNase adapter RapZ n=1 Tax=Gynuella sp. TaxID=2969146 RepID=UPI003D0A0F12
MKLIIISGRSGSGKTTVLQCLEDNGYNCIDNMPVALLPELTRLLYSEHQESRVAVCIDARNAPSSIKSFPRIVEQLNSKDIQCEIVFLDANDDTLLQRYSATRRKHPLSGETLSLAEAIDREKQILDPIANLADLAIDSTTMSLQELRSLIKQRVAGRQQQHLGLMFTSFGYKHGVPTDADFVFDVRCLPNPYWDPSLRQYTGIDQEIIEFLKKEPEVNLMFEDIYRLLDRWIASFEANNRSYLTVAIGCTGGQHRSVFLVEQLASAFRSRNHSTQIRHRELKLNH